MRYRSQVVGD